MKYTTICVVISESRQFVALCGTEYTVSIRMHDEYNEYKQRIHTSFIYGGTLAVIISNVRSFQFSISIAFD